MESLNQQLFLYINSYIGRSHTIDFFLVFTAKYLPYIFIGLLFYLWFNNKKNEALYAGYATTLAVGINLFIGLFYFHNRPFMDNIGMCLLSHKPENSFPSDHTTFVISIALMLITFKSTKSLGVVAFIFALWCGVARVYCGVHYPFDIFGSIVVSTIAIVMIILLKNRLEKLNKIIIHIWEKIFITIRKKNEKNK
jgi:undecaprenyl-diphosphatase